MAVKATYFLEGIPGEAMTSPSRRSVMNIKDPSERELVQRIRDGDQSAFRELFGRYEAASRARVHRKLPLALRRKVDPEDVLQDAYLVAAQRFEGFEGKYEGSFGSWVAQIVAFKTREVVRHYMDTARRDAHLEVTRGARPDTSYFRGRRTTPSQAFFAGELQARVESAMVALPDDDRRIIHLVQVQDLTLRQAAAELDCSYEATKKRYSRALARLRELMDLEAP